MKKTVLLIITLVVNSFLYGQTQVVTFHYDEAGNRTEREIGVILMSDNSDTTSSLKAATTMQTDPDRDDQMCISGTQIRIYPNPNGGKFTISLTGYEMKTSASMQLHNLSGSKVKEIATLNRETLIDISNQPNGTYILTIRINGEKKIWKVIKQ